MLIALKGITGKFLNELICLNSFLYILWILIILLLQYSDDNYNEQIRKNVVFLWYMTSVFIYSLCTIMVFAFWQFIKNLSVSTAHIVKAIHSVFNINLYVCISIGIWLDKMYNVKALKPVE